MRKEIIQTGESAAKAIESACMLLGVKQVDCEFEIIDLPKSSFFGLIKTPAKVRVWVEVADPVKEVKQESRKEEKVVEVKKVVPAPSLEPVKEKVTVEEITSEKVEVELVTIESPTFAVTRGLDLLDQEKITVAADYVKEMMKNMGIEAQIDTRVDNDIVTVAIEGRGLGTIIGRRGETLNALQYLTGLVANRLEGEYLRINVDAGDYRLKRNEALLEMTKKAVEEVLRTDISQALEAMNPAERRTVHSAASEYKGVSSASVGSEPYRRVVIKTATSKSPRDNRRRPSGSRDEGGDRSGNRGRNHDRNKDRSWEKKSGPRIDSNDRKYSPSKPAETKPVIPVIPVVTKDTKGDTPLYGKIDFD